MLAVTKESLYCLIDKMNDSAFETAFGLLLPLIPEDDPKLDEIASFKIAEAEIAAGAIRAYDDVDWN